MISNKEGRRVGEEMSTSAIWFGEEKEKKEEHISYGDTETNEKMNRGDFMSTRVRK